jgi:hypothetical protein
MLHWLWKETVGKLESLERALMDRRAVEYASDYARWIEFSGLLKIFDAYPQPPPLRVDGEAVRALVTRVVESAGQILKGGNAPFNPNTAKLDEINSKFDFLLSQLAKNISPPEQTQTTLAGSPAVHVLAGGAISDSDRAPGWSACDRVGGSILTRTRGSPALTFDGVGLLRYGVPLRDSATYQTQRVKTKHQRGEATLKAAPCLLIGESSWISQGNRMPSGNAKRDPAACLSLLLLTNLTSDMAKLR